MPRVSVKLNHWLRERIEPTSPEEIFNLMPERETILGLVGSLTAENGIVWKSTFDGGGQGLLANLLVIQNGRIVNPHDRAQTLLNEGDEVRQAEGAVAEAMTELGASTPLKRLGIPDTCTAIGSPDARTN